MIVTDLTNIPEAVAAYYAEEFSPSYSDNMSVAVQWDVRETDAPDVPTYQVFGSNITKDVDNMLPVVDEAGNSDPRSIELPFVKSYFPYKYLAISFDPQNGDGSGTCSCYIEKKAQRVNIA